MRGEEEERANREIEEQTQQEEHNVLYTTEEPAARHREEQRQTDIEADNNTDEDGTGTPLTIHHKQTKSPTHFHTNKHHEQTTAWTHNHPTTIASATNNHAPATKKSQRGFQRKTRNYDTDTEDENEKTPDETEEEKDDFELPAPTKAERKALINQIRPVLRNSFHDKLWEKTLLYELLFQIFPGGYFPDDVVKIEVISDASLKGGNCKGRFTR